MLPGSKLALWALTGALAVTTVFFNSYIFLMSVWSYRQRRRWSPSETIIVALALAAVGHQLVCYFWMTMDEVDNECNVAPTPYTAMLLVVYSLKFTIMWDAGFLTFYYSTKLVAAASRCYTQLQASILKHVTLAVVVIPLCGVGTCMPMLAVFHHDNQTAAAAKDCGVLVPDTPAGKIYEVAFLILSDVLPGALMIKCCVSISAHLAVHLRRMKASTNGAHAPKLGSQLRVIRMALSLVAVFLVFLVVDLYVQYQISVNHENIIVLTFFFTSVYTTVTAVVLIYGKKTFWKALVGEVNVCVAAYPCVACLKLPEEEEEEEEKAKAADPEKVKN